MNEIKFWEGLFLNENYNVCNYILREYQSYAIVYYFRTIRLNGQDMAILDDIDPNRINVEVWGGMITKVDCLF